mmetsp:Transcript_14992/g.38019  ORF Transcript_14992/g.38019 Transcript_14992/m.38019 type:complete len:258 (-) Transcript_14992:1396-2169(-)
MWPVASSPVSGTRIRMSFPLYGNGMLPRPRKSLFIMSLSKVSKLNLGSRCPLTLNMNVSFQLGFKFLFTTLVVCVCGFSSPEIHLRTTYGSDETGAPKPIIALSAARRFRPLTTTIVSWPATGKGTSGSLCLQRSNKLASFTGSVHSLAHFHRSSRPHSGKWKPMKSQATVFSAKLCNNSLDNSPPGWTPRDPRRCLMAAAPPSSVMLASKRSPQDVSTVRWCRGVRTSALDFKACTTSSSVRWEYSTLYPANWATR